jgi:hypothetical protein
MILWPIFYAIKEQKYQNLKKSCDLVRNSNPMSLHYCKPLLTIQLFPCRFRKHRKG